ncbi:DUF4367 domain-containing protein [Pseudoflavonifractor phocaeensis]|uniref:DUF4367 domain-containing protein n=1 Tax=Pseudoflavonifractor phocaeensis TaxID=1870988 RepID=UPI00210B21C9|nr:DUF4367 domain-containing protein [Pseudoflavonifractor phocaeensis]MCQ4864940.1 DUF4367 domain-containing protein [Pseudoflavonifractor phocaeensis]
MNDNLKDIVEQSQEEALQRIIDRQEGKLAREELKEPGPAPTVEELAHWSSELDRLEQDASRKGLSRRKWGMRLIVVAALLGALLALSVGAIRAGILNLFIDAQEQFTQITTSQSPERVVAGWRQFYLPSSLPDGYTMSSPINDEDMKSIEYSNSAGERILYYQYSPNSNIRLDTEKADKQYYDSIIGETAYLFEKGALSTLYWSTDGYILSIEFNPASVTSEDILDMAKSVQFIS